MIRIIPVDVWRRTNKNGKPLEMREKEITFAASVRKAEHHSTLERLIFEKKKGEKNLKVTQNAIKANEKPANSIKEANENGTGDSALKAGWAHSPNKPTSVTASLHLN